MRPRPLARRCATHSTIFKSPTKSTFSSALAVSPRRNPTFSGTTFAASSTSRRRGSRPCGAPLRRSPGMRWSCCVPTASRIHRLHSRHITGNGPQRRHHPMTTTACPNYLHAVREVLTHLEQIHNFQPLNGPPTSSFTRSPTTARFSARKSATVSTAISSDAPRPGGCASLRPHLHDQRSHSPRS